MRVQNNIFWIFTLSAISTGLERIGDYAKNIAKRVAVIQHKKTISVSSVIMDQMVAQISSMISDVIDAYINRDIERAGDHAINIAELVYYINEGELLDLKRPKDDSSNYLEIDAHL